MIEGVTMCTGFDAPSRIGLTATPDDVAFKRLKAMLALSRLGMISRLAAPCSREFGKISSRMNGDSAASACISPSASRSDAQPLSNASAWRILTDEGVSASPKLECETNATLGSMPKRRTSSAAIIAISASCSAVGSYDT